LLSFALLCIRLLSFALLCIRLLSFALLCIRLLSFALLCSRSIGRDFAFGFWWSSRLRSLLRNECLRWLKPGKVQNRKEHAKKQMISIEPEEGEGEGDSSPDLGACSPDRGDGSPDLGAWEE
jgi:hypothetical protein